MFERIGELWLERKTPTAGPLLGRLLLVHGMWGGSWYWAHWLRRFADAGWDVWAVNLRGHQGSQPGTTVDGVSLRDYVSDVVRCVTYLGDVALLGHSMGGLLAQKAAEGAALRALVLVTSAPPRGIIALPWPVLRRLPRYMGPILTGRGFVPSEADARALALNNVSPEVARDAVARLVPESGRAAREIALGRVAVDPRRVRGPVLVLGGGRDVILPAALQRRIAARYRAEYRELAGHAHMPMLEDGWDAVADDLLGWLGRHAR